MALFRNPPNPFLGIAKQYQTNPESSFNFFSTALDYLGRPASAVSGFAKGLVEGDIPEAFENVGDAITGEKRFNFKQVLKKMGVGKGPTVDLPFLGDVSARGTAGLALDILLDPLNLVTLFGTAKAGKGLRKFLPNEVTDRMGAVAENFGKQFSALKNAQITKATKEIDDLRGLAVRLKQGNSKFIDAVIPGAAEGQAVQGPSKLIGKTNPAARLRGVERKIAKKLGLPLTKPEDIWAIMDDEARFNAAKMAAVNNINDLATKPENFQLFKDEFLEKNPDILNNVHPRLDASTLADEVLNLNQSRVQMLRNINSKDMGVLGGWLTDRTKKGYSSTITFAGRSPAEIAKSLGLPDIVPLQLKRVDQFVANIVSGIAEKAGKIPLFKQLRSALNMGTGVPELDFYFASLKDIKKGDEVIVSNLARKIQEKQDDFTKGMDDATKHTWFKQVTDLMESDNPKLNLDSYRAKLSRGEEVLPGANEFALILKKHLDEDFTRHGLAIKDLGGNARYLRGYFPREVTKEGRQFIADELEKAGIFDKLLPKTHKARSGAGAELSTQEMNDLFRDHGLGWSKINDILKDPEKLKQFTKLDRNAVDFFITDPALAVGNRLIRQQRVHSEAEMTSSLLKAFGQNVFDGKNSLLPGEVLFNPSEFFSNPSFNKLPVTGQRKILKDIMGISAPAEQLDRVLAAMKRISSNRMRELLYEGAKPTKVSETIFTSLNTNSPNLLATLYDMKVPVFKMPKELFPAIENFWKAKNDPAVLSSFMKGYDRVTAIWTRLSLAPFPSYHFRNMVGDLWNNHLAGINPITEWGKNGAYSNALTSIKEMGLISSKDANLRLLDNLGKVTGSVTDSLGAVLENKKLMQEFIENGGFSGILKDLNISADSPMEAIRDQLNPILKGRANKEIANRVLNPLSKDFIPVKAGIRASELVSLQNRLGHFIWQRKNGLAADEAMMSVKKYLFDYDHLSNFERNTLKKIFPFYTWTRNNIPLQVQAMAKSPGKFANLMLAVQALEDETLRKEIPEEGIPSYIKSEFGVPVRKTGEGIYEFQLLGNYIPAADLMKIGNPKEVARMVLKSLNPIPQTALENSINLNFFSQQPISAYSGEKGKFLGLNIDKTQINAARKVRILNSADKMFFGEDPNDPYRKKGFSLAEKGIAALTGLKVNRLDVEKIAQKNDRAAGQIASKMRAAYREATKIGDTQTLRYLEELMQQSEKLKPKFRTPAQKRDF